MLRVYKIAFIVHQYLHFFVQILKSYLVDFKRLYQIFLFNAHNLSIYRRDPQTEL